MVIYYLLPLRTKIALRKKFGKPRECPGRHGVVHGRDDLPVADRRGQHDARDELVVDVELVELAVVVVVVEGAPAVVVVVVSPPTITSPSGPWMAAIVEAGAALG